MKINIINYKLKIVLDQLQTQIEEYYGDRLIQMILFGSQARGDAHPDSNRV